MGVSSHERAMGVLRVARAVICGEMPEKGIGIHVDMWGGQLGCSLIEIVLLPLSALP